MYPLRERFLERDKQGGVWVYSMSFGLKTMAVEPPVADNYPLFVLGVAQEVGGITTISVAPAPFVFNDDGEVQLPNGNLLTTEVLNASTDNLYEPGNDYTVDTVTGTISVNPAGALAPGATVNIGYSYAETVIATPAELDNPLNGAS
jgi:hypothetical protein